MRHWELLRNYPKITEETSEALEDLLEIVKVSLEALEKSSKLPSSIIRKWQRTLPSKRMLSYTYLMEFLQTRANDDDIRTKSNKTKRSSHQYPRHRQNLSRGQTFITTSRTLVCPTCHGPHEIKHCKIFKGISATKRYELVKKASLCTNCPGRGHSCPMFSWFVSYM